MCQSSINCYRIIMLEYQFGQIFYVTLLWVISFDDTLNSMFYFPVFPVLYLFQIHMPKEAVLLISLNPSRKSNDLAIFERLSPLPTAVRQEFPHSFCNSYFQFDKAFWSWYLVPQRCQKAFTRNVIIILCIRYIPQ